ncbi:MAG: hypothetical protein ACREFL_01310 [Stellaceae bacterium]
MSNARAAMEANVRTDLGGAETARVESPVSAVSWAAIIAGALAAAAASLILLALGSGLGLASVSPWSGGGLSAAGFGIAAGIWLIVVQWLASALGGYLTGRLRSKWVGTHSYEVFFRDTAHGFLAWALATLASAMLLAGATSSIVGGGVRAAANVAGGAAQGAVASNNASGNASGGSATSGSAALDPYDLDALFRSDRSDANAPATESRAEALRIIAHGAASGDVPQADRTYLAQQVSARTGISPDAAAKRVDNAIGRAKALAAEAKKAADTARKSAAALAIFTALSMVIGAFIASTAAALGGRQREEYP